MSTTVTPQLEPELLKSRIGKASEQRMNGSPSAWADGFATLRAKEAQIREKVSAESFRSAMRQTLKDENHSENVG